MPTKEEILKSRILIVDDEPSNVLLLETILEEEGYHNLQSLTDPRQVVAAYQEYRHDLILLDIRMPHLSGIVNGCEEWLKSGAE